MAPLFSARTFPRTAGWVILAIVALSAADTFLARTERVESAAEAAQLFGEGRRLMQRGENAAAIERIQDAILIERGNRDYGRTLAEAQLAAGKTVDAESTLTDLLQSDSNDGLANLFMGRVLVKENRFVSAVSYYHRAIYGQWNEQEEANRLRARFELIDLLAVHNSKAELLAELLPVQDQMPRDLNARAQMGRLFLLAGSPPRAATVFQDILNDAPTNAAAHAGLGEAEFAQGNYRAAQRDFAIALRLAPDDAATRKRIDVCNHLLMLDPTVRGLGSAERFRRSRELLELAKQAAIQCAGPNASPELQELLAKAAKAVQARVGAVREGEVSESMVDMAEQLWQMRGKECASSPEPDSPLALLLARLVQ